MRQSLIHFIARVALAAVFAYQGLVPKLLTRNVDEIAMLRDAGVAAGVTGSVVTALGILELAFAVALLFAWHRRWPVFVCLGVDAPGHRGGRAEFTAILRGGVQPVHAESRGRLPRGIDLLVLGSIPSAARCLRRPCPEKA